MPRNSTLPKALVQLVQLSNGFSQSRYLSSVIVNQLGKFRSRSNPKETLTTAASQTNHRKFVANSLLSGVEDLALARLFFSTPLSRGSSNLQVMEVASNIFAHAVSSVLPHQMIEKNLKYDASTCKLRIASREYLLKHNVHVVGFGKAVLGMARALEDAIGDHVVDGVVSIPVGSRDALETAGLRDMLLLPTSKIRVMEGAADNLPDQAAHQAAQEIARVVETVGADDILIVLISGGGSALLPYPVPPLTLDDTLTVTRLLARSGVNILDLNMVRKQLERLKGGGLARLAHPAKVISLILSDIIGDDLGFIASGPTVPNTTTAQHCLELFRRYNVTASVPPSVMAHLKSKAPGGAGMMPEDFSHVSNVLIGTNRIACDAASSKSSSFGFMPYVLSTELSGEAKTVGVMFAILAKYIANVSLELRHADPTKSMEVKIKGHISGSDTTTTMLRQQLMKEFAFTGDTLRDVDKLVLKAQQSKSAQGVCIVAGGETTVTVRGKGKGGRNQEMALAAGIELHNYFYNYSDIAQKGASSNSSIGQNLDENPAFIRRFGELSSARGLQSKNIGSNKEEQHQFSAQDLVFLSAGTDGQDGPTSAAGGMVDGDFFSKAAQAGLDVSEYLANNDSFTLLTKLDGGSNLVVTGLTGTNVMDLQILVVRFPKS